MTDTVWNPDLYLAFGGERLRPFMELLGRIPVQDPKLIVDLGCGPGNGETPLRARWSEAHIVGVDSSAQMIAQAREKSGPHTQYVQDDVLSWLRSAQKENMHPDIIVSNAMFQWVPNHLEFLPEVADLVADGGSFALQVPGNFNEPSHALLREIAYQSKYKKYLTDPLLEHVITAREYLDVLARPGFAVDAWETNYIHILQGEDPVFTWVSSTAARPVLNVLPDTLRDEFIDEYKRALREAYPSYDYGTPIRFRREFAVATRL